MELLFNLFIVFMLLYALFRIIAAFGGLLTGVGVIFFRDCSVEGFKVGYVVGDIISRRMILDIVFLIFASIIFIGFLDSFGE